MSTLEPILPLHIDSTMMTCFRSCPQKYWKEFVLGLRPPHISVDLHAGGCFATALEHVYKGVWERQMSTDDALDYGHAAFMLAWGDFEIPEWKRTGKTRDNMWKAVEHYFERWDPRGDYIPPYLNADGKPTIEYSFAIPLEGDDWPLHPSGTPFVYVGRFDLLGELRGRPCVRDEKTTGKSISGDWSSQWDLRSQFIGYTWACQQAGLDVDTVVVRGISILKTKIDSQEAEKIYSDDLRARWLDQLRRDLWRLRRQWDEGYFDYNFGDSCTSYGNCIFLTACSAPKHQEASWLSEFAVSRWNPLQKIPVETQQVIP